MSLSSRTKPVPSTNSAGKDLVRSRKRRPVSPTSLLVGFKAAALELGVPSTTLYDIVVANRANVRTGFFEHHQYESVRAHLPESVQPDHRKSVQALVANDGCRH